MDHKRYWLFSLLACAAPFGLALVCGGRPHASGGKDDVVVRAPGVSATSDDNGVSVKAPLGIEIKVGDNRVSVKAPGVDVKADENGVAVDAPLGVTVRTGSAGSAKAP